MLAWAHLGGPHGATPRTPTNGCSEAIPSRTFCIPRGQVEASKAAERVLLFLAASLMESFGLQVNVCTEPEYTALQGFVLDQRRRAIVANWVGQDGIWYVDVTDHRGKPRSRLLSTAGVDRACSFVGSLSR